MGNANDFISGYIKLANIEGKGLGYIATTDILPGTIILWEEPKVKGSDAQSNNIWTRNIQIIDKILKNDTLKKEFMSLMPIKDINSDGEKEFVKLCIATYKNEGNNICTLKEYSDDDLVLFFKKVSRNCFGFEKRTCVILFKGTRFNHSCIPNVEYICDKNKIIFQTTKIVKMGEELKISYINKNLSYEERKKVLSVYGFLCICERCKTDMRSKL